MSNLSCTLHSDGGRPSFPVLRAETKGTKEHEREAMDRSGVEVSDRGSAVTFN